MRGKLCLITGGNSGIGLETAVGIASAGARIVLVSRDRGRGEAAVADVKARSGNGEVELMTADLSSQREVRRLAEEAKARYPKIDVLVNNAGLIMGERVLTEDGYETTWAVNHLAYFMLSLLLLDAVEASGRGRIVNVASDAHRSGKLDFENLQGERSYGSWKAYSQSKLANIAFTYELARKLGSRHVTANCLHPGVIATNFGASGGPLMRLGVKLLRPFFTGAAKGAETSVYLATSPEVDGVTGRYFVSKREARSNAESRDPAVAERLWRVSEEQTGVRWGQA